MDGDGNGDLIRRPDAGGDGYVDLVQAGESRCEPCELDLRRHAANRDRSGAGDGFEECQWSGVAGFERGIYETESDGVDHQHVAGFGGGGCVGEYLRTARVDSVNVPLLAPAVEPTNGAPSHLRLSRPLFFTRLINVAPSR